VRLAVDAGQCTGHGRCYTMAPDLLTFDDEGYVTIRGESIAVPEDLRDVARYAADSCPEGAVTLIAE
jgi:ferredoxin